MAAAAAVGPAGGTVLVAVGQLWLFAAGPADACSMLLPLFLLRPMRVRSGQRAAVQHAVWVAAVPDPAVLSCACLCMGIGCRYSLCLTRGFVRAALLLMLDQLTGVADAAGCVAD